MCPLSGNSVFVFACFGEHLNLPLMCGDWDHPRPSTPLLPACEQQWSCDVELGTIRLYRAVFVITYLSATVLPKASGKWQFFHRPPGRKQEEGLCLTSISVCRDVAFLPRRPFDWWGQLSNFPAVWVIRVREDIISFQTKGKLWFRLQYSPQTFHFFNLGDLRIPFEKQVWRHNLLLQIRWLEVLYSVQHSFVSVFTCKATSLSTFNIKTFI